MLRFGSHQFGSSAQIMQPTSNHLKMAHAFVGWTSTSGSLCPGSNCEKGLSSLGVEQTARLHHKRVYSCLWLQRRGPSGKIDAVTQQQVKGNASLRSRANSSGATPRVGPLRAEHRLRNPVVSQVSFAFKQLLGVVKAN